MAKEGLTCVLGFLCVVSQSYIISLWMDFRQSVLVVVGFLFIYLLNLRATATNNQKNEKTSQILEAPGHTWRKANSFYRRRSSRQVGFHCKNQINTF